MTKPAPSTEATELRGLLTTVLDALTLPYSAADYDKRLLDRAALVRTIVGAALAEAPADLGWNADYLRQKLAAEQAEADERATNKCGRCHQPFDPTDTRFDGHARHGDTPYCRSCVDNCHEGSAEHVCVICHPARYGGGQ
ncbi:hypothetical protein [Streptomyces ipomoeae]|uniref:hypothetical protein n=1 Tax=Streptomyces ipomoeae TaxID=103232 RepID=UPI0029A89822|nr:hypothetical protein [Streptomyces ipomoeae]MDX2696857.1 DUF1588 domain-containing protein [Streptomyces ipomoeae]MDX2843153.1 DUF1588 domain-containing protein [Streptomyces ipomoeae]